MRMVATKRVFVFLICLFYVLAMMLVLPFGEIITPHAQGAVEIVDTKDELEIALANANEGDVIEIGDITYLPTEFWLTINKSITIKSALNERATIIGGFGIKGGTIESEKITVRLENINFAGFNDLKSLTLTDDVYLQSQESLTLKQCLVISGFVDIKIVNCDFSGFAQTIGGAIGAMYGKSGANEYCRLSLSMENCKFNGNAANQGSAAYLYGYNNNIKLYMTDCEITENTQQRAPLAMFGTVANIKRCLFAENKLLNLKSLSGGGAIYAKESELTLTDCRVINNQATDGGGLYLYYSKAFIDGCVIAGNTAKEITVETVDWDFDTGDEIYSYETVGGYGGGIYIDGNQLLRCYIVNSSIYANKSQHDGGATFVNYRNEATIRVECSLSTIGMHSESNGNLIASNSDAYEMSVFGCILISANSASTTLAVDANYNYTATLTQLNDANIFSQQTLESAKGHVVPDGKVMTAIPQSEFTKWANGKYKNAYGNVHIGANGTEPTVITYVEENVTQTVAYGEEYSLLKPSKVGFSFVQWKTAKKGGTPFEEGKLLLSGEILLYPEWKPNTLTIVLPIVAAVLIVLSGVIAFFLVRHRKKTAVHTVQDLPVAEECAEAGTTVPIIGELIKENVALIKDEYKLSAREAEVIELLLEGKSSRKISEELFISFDTVRFHCKNIYKKLSIHSQTELINFCQNYTKK